MRRLDTENVYSGRSYFFGMMAFICFLIQRSLVGVQVLTRKSVPNALYIIIALLFITVTVVSVYYAIQSLKEPATFKKIVGLLATGFASFQLFLNIASLF